MPRTAKELFIPGTPVPQPRPRAVRRGNFARVYPKETKGYKGWRSCLIAGLPNRPEDKQFGYAGVPFVVYLGFILRRGQHFKADGLNLKKGAPLHPIAANTGDVDNLAKMVLDHMSGRLIIDDAPIVGLQVVKRYQTSVIEDTGVFISVADHPREVAAFVERICGGSMFGDSDDG